MFKVAQRTCCAVSLAGRKFSLGTGILMLALSAPGAEPSSQSDDDFGRIQQNLGSSRNFSPVRSHSEDDNSIEAQISVGFESNVFQVNGQLENPVADGFVDSSVDLAVPLKQIGEEVRLNFNGTSKIYFREDQIDEYRLQPELIFGGMDLGGATLELDARIALLRERIFNQFGQIPDRSEPGASGGIGWNLESTLCNRTNFVWKGEVEYESFFSAPNDNIRLASEGEFKTPLNEHLELNGGTEWEFQRYRVRPRDIESPFNPNSLATVEGRGFIGFESHLASNYSLEGALNAGPNIDLTNGYYDAAVIGARAEIRRRIGKCKLKGSAEPELVWFTRRPANLGKAADKLFTQEYIFEFEVEYDWSSHIKLFCSETVHFQESSSGEVRSDAVLNSFVEDSVRSGVIISF